MFNSDVKPSDTNSPNAFPCPHWGTKHPFVLRMRHGTDCAASERRGAPACQALCSGGYSAEAPSLPIPNRIVKLSRADGTAARWESRSPPPFGAPQYAGPLFFTFHSWFFVLCSLFFCFPHSSFSLLPSGNFIPSSTSKSSNSSQPRKSSPSNPQVSKIPHEKCRIFIVPTKLATSDFANQLKNIYLQILFCNIFFVIISKFYRIFVDVKSFHNIHKQ